MKMKRYTAAEVIANHICWDIADVRDMRYHYGHTSKPVFALESCYMCATGTNAKPPVHRNGDTWNWVKVNSSFADSIGWTIWEHKG